MHKLVNYVLSANPIFYFAVGAVILIGVPALVSIFV